MSKHSPTPVGAYLSDELVEKVAQTLYARYYYEHGLPQWKDDNLAPVRRKFTKRVKEVLDCLAINNLSVTKSIVDIEKNRAFLTKVGQND